MKNPIIIIPNMEEVIILARGAGHDRIPILVDHLGYQKLDGLVTGTFYVNLSKGTAYAFTAKMNQGTTRVRSMHRILTDCPDHLVVDHYHNHYGLDNRAKNLKLVTHKENSNNRLTTSGKPILFPCLTDETDEESIVRDIERIRTLKLND